MDEREQQPLAGSLMVSEEATTDGEDKRSRGIPGDGRAEQAQSLLQALLERMHLETDVSIRADEATEIVLDVGGQDAGRAIGKKGATLDSLQYFMNKAINKGGPNRRHIVLDSGDYRERHESGLVSMAEREAKRAVKMGRVVSLRPMNSRDRRIVHLSLAKFDGVSTESQGEGLGRRIQIIPADEAS